MEHLIRSLELNETPAFGNDLNLCNRKRHGLSNRNKADIRPIDLNLMRNQPNPRHVPIRFPLLQSYATKVNLSTIYLDKACGHSEIPYRYDLNTRDERSTGCIMAPGPLARIHAPSSRRTRVPYTTLCRVPLEEQGFLPRHEGAVELSNAAPQGHVRAGMPLPDRLSSSLNGFDESY